MNRNEDVAGARVIDGIARNAIEGNGSHERIGARIDDRIRLSVLVGYEDPSCAGSVGDAVRIFDGSSFRDGLQDLHGDNGDFMFSCRRYLDSAQLRNRSNTMNVGEDVEICHNFAFLRVETTS